MSRVAFSQTDLFAPTRPAEAVRIDPLAELQGLLARVTRAETLPWPDAAATMAEERRALSLARMAGPEGERLAGAILEQTERLLAQTDG